MTGDAASPPPAATGHEEDAALDAALDAAMAQVPRGAAALAGAALALVVAAWLLVYFAVYLPRGSVG